MRISQPFAVILGTNDIASAVAVHLFRNGHGVVLSHDPHPPVIRRRMSFFDSLFDDAVTLDGVSARRVDSGLDLRTGLHQRAGVLVTELGLLDLIVIQTIDVLVDARMQKYRTKPDLRRLAKFTIGLGPGFCGGTNCDIAIETRPEKAGIILQDGFTDAADGTPRRLGRYHDERFVRAEVAGRWHTAIEIGTRIFKDFVVGHLGNVPVRAPFDGVLRGVARDGMEVAAGVKLLEIDTRGRRASWTGIDRRAHMIAAASVRAIALHKASAARQRSHTLHLVK